MAMTTTSAMMATTTAAQMTTAEPATTPLRRLRVRASARLRIVGWLVLLVAFAVGASVLLLRQVLLDQLGDEVTAGLEQEVAEMRALATGRDPATGQPFADDVAAIFTTFVDRNIPNEGEALFTFVDGAPFRSSFAVPYALDGDPDVIRQWADLETTSTGTLDTPAGPARYLAVPLRQGADTAGVFVVANFVEGERAEVDDAIRTSVAISVAVLIMASLLAWVIAGRVLAPVKTLTDTARSITESDLTQRIPVEGNDQIAELTATFNAMLDRLEAAFVTQRSFMDDAGHELRTPITIIRGHLELLGDDPAEREEVVAIVTDELDRMSRQVDDMLLLAKAERPGFLDREPIDLGTVSDEWLAKMRTLADREWRLGKRATGTVVVDRQRLTQAVMNLAENAARHTGTSGVIELRTEDRNGEVRITVADDGPGIAPEDQERIFERFARGVAGPERSQSSGLGLAIVRAIADAHRGRVELVSQPGHGAAFTVVIPSPAEGSADPWRAS
jgi:two-component system OmpR family sensor kinase